MKRVVKKRRKHVEILDYVQGKLLSKPKKAHSLLKRISVKNILDEDKFRYYHTYGLIYSAQDKYKKAIRYYGCALGVNASSDEKAECLYDLGSSLEHLNRPEEALQFLLHALSLEKNQVQRGRIHTTIAMCHNLLNDLPNAIKAGETALSLFESSRLSQEDAELICSNLVLMLSIYVKADEDERADNCYEKLLKLGNLSPTLTAQVYEIQGSRYLERSDYRKAEEFFLKALELETNKRNQEYQKKALKVARLRLSSL